ncbi:hypothetical protein BV20DRAFT_637728 [Pilatotrama ljubarskyi]|nr:hypothetical protein BV20DRAFT_637728 [Pilatotrama ljubarskyi]
MIVLLEALDPCRIRETGPLYRQSRPSHSPDMHGRRPRLRPCAVPQHTPTRSNAAVPRRYLKLPRARSCTHICRWTASPHHRPGRRCHILGRTRPDAKAPRRHERLSWHTRFAGASTLAPWTPSLQRTVRIRTPSRNLARSCSRVLACTPPARCLGCDPAGGRRQYAAVPNWMIYRKATAQSRAPPWPVIAAMSL